MKNQKEEASTRVQSLESQVCVMERKHEGEVESAKDEAKTEMEAEFRVLEETVKSMEMGDNELTKKVAELQAKTEADRIEYTHCVREVGAEHGKEIEELLSQLDRVSSFGAALDGPPNIFAKKSDLAGDLVDGSLAPFLLDSFAEASSTVFLSCNPVVRSGEISGCQVDVK
jgi:hypothetical protein